jgi:hypothetical protein
MRSADPFPLPQTNGPPHAVGRPGNVAVNRAYRQVQDSTVQLHTKISAMGTSGLPP